MKTANGINTLTVSAKAPPQTSDRILSADLTGGAVNVGCGWTASVWNL